jgi:hypothetical protein
VRPILIAGLLLAGCGDAGEDSSTVTSPDAGDASAGPLDGGGTPNSGTTDGALAAPADAGVSPRDADASGDAGASAVGVASAAMGKLFPTGFSVASPLAQHRMKVMRRVDPNGARTPVEKVEMLGSVLAGIRLDDCGVMLSGLAMAGSGDNVSCYGPQLDYQGHPDGSPDSGQFPGGDLGLWEATEGATGEACAAAKLNALVSGIARKVDFGLFASAAMVCSGRVAGLIAAKAEADAGVSDGGTASASPLFSGRLDLKAKLAEALAFDPAVTVNAAMLERMEDAEGEAIHYTLELAVKPGAPVGGGPMPVARTIVTELVHRVHPAETGSYHGRIWSTSSGSGASEAYSVSYAQNAMTGHLRYHTVSASFDAGKSPTFVDGRLAINSDWSSNAAQGIFDMTPSDGTGSVSFAWQAGADDSHARIFHASTGTSGTVATGCGFFSYGTRFNRSESDPMAWPENSFQTFICNWAGPGNSHAGRSHFAQKQCMRMDDAGKFVPTTNAISYAPVNTCDSTATSFAYKRTMASSYSTTPITSALVDVSTDTDYAAFVAPARLF